MPLRCALPRGLEIEDARPARPPCYPLSGPRDDPLDALAELDRLRVAWSEAVRRETALAA